VTAVGERQFKNTARHALFLRTSREAKYKAKGAIDSFFWRAGMCSQQLWYGAQETVE